MPESTQPTSSVTGNVVAPGLGAPVVATAPLVAGSYEVTIFAEFSAGSPILLDSTNMQLRNSGTAVGLIEVPAALNSQTKQTFVVNVGQNGILSVNAVAAATAGVGYQVEMEYALVA